MRAIRAAAFDGYKSLELIDLPKPSATEVGVLVRITAVGVTHWPTILEGDLSRWLHCDVHRTFRDLRKRDLRGICLGAQGVPLAYSGQRRRRWTGI